MKVEYSHRKYDNKLSIIKNRGIPIIPNDEIFPTEKSNKIETLLLLQTIVLCLLGFDLSDLDNVSLATPDLNTSLQILHS